MKTIIEINGRKYDAQTGKQVMSSDKSTPTPPKSNCGVIDGFSRHKPVSNINKLPENSPKITNIVTPPQRRPIVKSLDIKPSAHKLQKSKTLSRNIVKKPQSKAPEVHSTSSIVSSNIEKSASGRGVLLKRVPKNRLMRASSTTKLPFINKFDRTSKIKPVLSNDLKLKSEPIQETPNNAAPFIANQAPAKQQVFEHPKIQYDAKSSTANYPKKSLFSGFSINRKFATITAVFVAVLLLSAFFVYQNVPSVGMRIAASKAGFSGKFPSSTPAGYSFKGPIMASKGNIVLNFQSNSDDRKFVVSQKPTSWTSESLLTNYLVDSKLRYQTYHDKGMTVFIYNDSNATWVDKGIWYTVKGDGSLSSEQILEIASSI